MAKLPYISNKRLYAAVMGACSYVKETGYFNKATSYYADKYNVPVEDVRRYVRIAQGNGQREKAKRSPTKYYWYVAVVMEDYYHGDDCGTYSSWEWTVEEKLNNSYVTIKKATSQKNAKSALEDTGNHIFDRHKEPKVIYIRGFQSEKDAKSFYDGVTRDFIRENASGF